MPEHRSKRHWCQSSEQLLEFFRHAPNDFLSQLVTMDKTCLYHYDPETKQQSVEWWHSNPKNFQVQKSAGKVLASIFLDQDGILLIDCLPKGQNYQCRVLLISAGAIEGHFEGKMLWEVHQGGSCSCTTMPQLTGPLLPRRNWPTWASSVLITHPILRIWPHQTTTCSLHWKNN